MRMPFSDEHTPIRGLEERIEALVESRTPKNEPGLLLSAHASLLSRNESPYRNVRGRWQLIIAAIVLPLIILGAVLITAAAQMGFAASLLGGTSKIPANVGHAAPIFNNGGGSGLGAQPTLPPAPVAPQHANPAAFNEPVGGCSTFFSTLGFDLPQIPGLMSCAAPAAPAGNQDTASGGHTHAAPVADNGTIGATVS